MSTNNTNLSHAKSIVDAWDKGNHYLTKPQLEFWTNEVIKLTEMKKTECKHTKCNNLSYVIEEYDSGHQLKYNDIYCAECHTCLIYGYDVNNCIFTSDIDQDLLTCIKFHEDKCGAIDKDVLKDLGVCYNIKYVKTYYRR